jgi:hypothetical protein
VTSDGPAPAEGSAVPARFSSAREREAEVSIAIDAAPDAAYALVSDMRVLAKLSPECFAVWRIGRAYVGWNRRGPIIWATSVRVRVAEPGAEFAFDVSSFGWPVARWGYRFVASGGGVIVTEYWRDRRGGVMDGAGWAITFRPPAERADMNRRGMRITLERLKSRLEA